MTGPEQHAATVEEWVRSRMSPMDGPESRQAKSIAGRAALDELVALAGRAAPFQLEEAATFYRRQMEAAEARADKYDDEAERLGLLAAEWKARADELQRELEAERDAHGSAAQAGMDATVDLEQARREADQLRAALVALGWDVGQDQLCWCDERRFDRDETGVPRYDFENPDDHSDGCRGARAALAGVQADNKERTA